jgi:hypothetical protein
MLRERSPTLSPPRLSYAGRRYGYEDRSQTLHNAGYGTTATGRELPNVVKSVNVQTTCFAGVTSMICGLSGPAWQLTSRVLPHAGRGGREEGPQDRESSHARSSLMGSTCSTPTSF